MDQYFVSMSCEGRVFDICALAHAGMSAPSAYRLWRHVNLAHALAYVGLSETYTVANFLKPLNEKYGLCSRAEWKRLEELKPEAGGVACREAITWAVNDIMMQTKCIEQPMRALEKLSMVALLKRARLRKIDKQFCGEESPLAKMTLLPSDPRWLPPTLNEKQKIIAKIIEDPDCVCHTSIAEWDTATTKEWLLDLDGVHLDRNSNCTGDQRDVSKALNDHNIRGNDLLHMDPDKLQTLGITSISEQARILEAIGLIAGENEVISDMRASELVTQVCMLRGKLATLYDFKVSPSSRQTSRQRYSWPGTERGAVSVCTVPTDALVWRVIMHLAVEGPTSAVLLRAFALPHLVALPADVRVHVSHGRVYRSANEMRGSLCRRDLLV